MENQLSATVHTMNTGNAVNTATYKWQDVYTRKMMQQSAPKCSLYTVHILPWGNSKYNINLHQVNDMDIIISQLYPLTSS
jgi:hypothetical protein